MTYRGKVFVRPVEGVSVDNTLGQLYSGGFYRVVFPRSDAYPLMTLEIDSSVFGPTDVLKELARRVSAIGSVDTECRFYHSRGEPGLLEEIDGNTGFVHYFTVAGLPEEDQEEYRELEGFMESLRVGRISDDKKKILKIKPIAEGYRMEDGSMPPGRIQHLVCTLDGREDINIGNQYGRFVDEYRTGPFSHACLVDFSICLSGTSEKYERSDVLIEMVPIHNSMHPQGNFYLTFGIPMGNMKVPAGYRKKDARLKLFHDIFSGFLLTFFEGIKDEKTQPLSTIVPPRIRSAAKI